jgi:DNA replication initiation complex subunit (GINS family)
VVRDVHPMTEEERKHLSSILDIVGRQKAELLAKVDAKAEADQAEATGDEQAEQVQKATQAPNDGPVEGEYIKEV